MRTLAVYTMGLLACFAFAAYVAMGATQAMHNAKPTARVALALACAEQPELAVCER